MATTEPVPGPRRSPSEFVLNLLRIRRVEFRVAEVPILILPVLLERALGAPPVPAWVWIEAFFAFFFLFAFGDMINCLADRELDSIYKKHLSQAVYALGPRFVAFQVAASAVAALGITAHLSWRLDRWPLVPVVAAGLALGAAYSVEPVRFKGRGLLQMLCLWAIIFFGPMTFIALLLRPLPSVGLLLFAAAYATIQMGVVLVNSAEDFPEDRAAGVRNTIVSLGLERGVRLAAGMAAGGGLTLLAVLAALYARLGVTGAVWAVLLLPIAAASFVSWDIARLARSLAGRNEAEQVAFVKAGAKRVPVWITLVAWMTLAAVWMLYRATVK